MKIKEIELANISRYRGELMGAAMIFVILFHVGLPRDDTFFGLRRIGNIGVDIFLFLSGMGLWFSWTKRPSLSHFFSRRFLRIYPAWFIIACLYYIPDFLCPDFVGHSGHSANIIDLIGNITINWNFWINDELTFWYIPAIMALYLVSPFYMNLIIRSNDNVVHSCPICYANTRDFGTFRDLLESCTYLFLRYKHCSSSTKEGENGWSLYMDDSHYVCNGTCLQHLFRARKAWSVPYFPRKDALHPTDNHNNSYP